MSDIDVEVIRHCVGADGTMRVRLTFNVSIDTSKIEPSNLGPRFVAAMEAAMADARIVQFGTSRKDGMPLPPVDGAPVDPRAAVFAAGYDAGWNASGEGCNGEYTSERFTDEVYAARAKEALDDYLIEVTK